MKIRLNIVPVIHQKLFLEDIKTTFLHLSGGFGCGKTHVLVNKAVHLHWLNRPFSGGIIVPSLPEFKKDVLPEMEDVLYKNKIDYKYNAQDHYFKFPFSRGKMHVITAVNKIRGPNWAYACINEVTLIKKIRYQETVSRVRIKSAPHRQIASVGTPEGIGSEYHEMFVEQPMKGSRIIYGSTRDNLANLGDNYIEMLEQNYDSLMLQAYLDGQFVNMKGNRFYYNYNPGIHEDKTITPPEDGERVHISMDFNVDPMTAVCWKEVGREMHAFDEVILHNADTKKMAEALIVRGYDAYNSIIYPDPSGNARSTKGLPDIQQLRNAGFDNILVRKAHPTFRQRQLNTNNILEKKLIKIHPVKCPWMRKDFLAVEQDKVTLEKIKDNPKLTHTSDGFDYMCDILYPYSGKRPTNQVTKVR